MATLTLLKNTSNQAVVKVVGAGSSVIDISSLITTLPKTVTSVAGSNVVQMDAFGLSVGASVLNGTLIPVNTTITSIAGNSITLSAPATVSGDESVTFTTQTAVAPKVYINRATFSTTGSVTVNRGTDVLVVHGTGDWLFTDYALTDGALQNITVTLSDNGTCILVLRKVSGYGNEQGWNGA